MGEQFTTWRRNALPEKSDWMYHWTNFTLKLNHLPDSLTSKLPPSDSRLRPDQRALEEGDIETAANEKHRLEEKQRATRKFRHDNPGNDFEPKYFEKKVDEDTKAEYFAYGTKRDYWADRKKADWAHMEDIF